jgi:Skp family chaperone for outer membrane proteins
MSRLALAGLWALATVPAWAQTATTPVNPPLGGPQVPGVCLLSQPQVLANAKVGQAATARLRVLSEQAQAEVAADRGPLEAEAKALQNPKLKPGDRAAKQQALEPRVQALQAKANLRTREIEASRQKALARIVAEEQPVIARVYKAHNCGLLFDRAALLGGNLAGDLTAEVIQGLDAKIATIAFDRETLPDKPAGQ